MAGLVDAIRERLGGQEYEAAPTVRAGAKIPAKLKSRMDSGRRVMRQDAPKRRLCIRFERGDTYWYVTGKNVLTSQSTVTNPDGSGKPPHRIRNSYNFIRPIVEAKISQATQRIPSYEITPSTTDPEDIGAARLSEKVALYGYDQWHVRDATIDTVKHAIASGGEGFALPYFDSNVGPYVQVMGDDGTPTYQGLGELKVMVFQRNEVTWEPACRFAESRWWATVRAEPVEDVKEYPGFDGGKLEPDASTSDIPTDRPTNENLVMVTDYFERPCPSYPEGRRLRIANDRVICDEEPYPLRDHEGNVLDEPILHRLRYTHDPDSDNDFGLVWQLIDFQRTIQDCYNKLLEWKNRTLNPQMKAPIGSLATRPTDEPGAVIYYKPNPAQGNIPDWAPSPPVPEALFRILEQAKDDMRAVAADVQIQADPNVAARTSQAAIENAQAQWQSFLGDLAEWHSRLMRHCLLLVARYYTEPRLLAIKGRFGPERIEDFQGAQLMGQVDVRVLPGSIDALSKAQVQQQLSWIVANFPGYLSPEAAIAALNGGTAAKLIESYELDMARVSMIIEKIRDGTVMNMPKRTETIQVPGPPTMDPMTQQPVEGPPQTQTTEVPGWMPRDFDNLKIWKQVMSDWMKTQDYDMLDPGHQEVANLIYQGVLQKEAEQQQQAAAQQTQMAESLGMSNAAKPQEATPLPDQLQMGQDPSQPPGPPQG